MNCPRCSAQVAEESKFCPECGQPFSREPEPTAFTVQAPAEPAAPETTIHGRFVPGQRIGDRFRIVSLLGRGGMGEVYRADDLQLGQSVALKFLPPRVGADPVALERFKREVRTARQVTHPNVCRIHDLGQVEGQAFLSMEFLDGEDLSQVLKRLGRPTKEKALEITRQLCLGLAAAHEVGVIHRDLKPANIMIDGRGKVRIMDFGIAGLEEEVRGEGKLAGTPAYMAPELFQGGTPSVRTDIYALGLVLYETYTGKKAYEAEELRRLQNLHETATPTTPSSLVADMDPVVELVILRCLQKDPSERPGSVYAVLSALPGADPLAAMVAAGQTPSPELVAQSGEVGGLRPRTAVACLASIVVMGVAMAWMFQPRFAALGDSPERLALKAEEILTELGYEQLPRYSAAGFATRSDLLQAMCAGGNTPSAEDVAARGALFYWARWSPQPLVPASLHYPYPGLEDPPQSWPGSVTARLGMDGRLLALDVVPKVAEAETRPAVDAPDWTVLLTAAGLDPATLTALEPPARSAGTSEVTAAWEGSLPKVPAQELSFHARANAGRPVHFSMVQASEQPDEAGSIGSTDIEPSRSAVYWDWHWAFVIIVPLVAAGVLSWRNLRLGRGDQRGASIVAGVTWVAYMIEFMVSVNVGEQGLATSLVEVFNERALAHALLHAVPNWFLYMAIEPYARKMWPRILVSWARVTSGRLRDPLVGRDLLFGGLIGFAAALAVELGFRMGAGLGWMPSEVTPEPLELRVLASQAGMVRGIAHALAIPCIETFYALMFALLAQVLLKRFWLAVLFAFSIGASNWFISVQPVFGVFGALVVSIALTGALVLPLFRYGLLSALTAGFVVWVLSYVPATFDLSVWYADRVLLGLAAVFALIGFGFFTSLAGRPLFRDVLAEPASKTGLRS